MQLAFLHDYCTAKPGVEETLPFGPDTLVYKVMGKAFVLTGIDDIVSSINVKCDPELAETLREQYSFVLPGYHMNKKHWNTIDTTQAPQLLVQQWIDHSYDLVVSKLTKKEKEALAQLK